MFHQPPMVWQLQNDESIHIRHIQDLALSCFEHLTSDEQGTDRQRRHSELEQKKFTENEVL
uniref:Uncharacterized protein n=1 Tax=Arundo donax TaxID=35708 RepID=A0A0A9H275_ARUDO